MPPKKRKAAPKATKKASKATKVSSHTLESIQAVLAGGEGRDKDRLASGDAVKDVLLPLLSSKKEKAGAVAASISLLEHFVHNNPQSQSCLSFVSDANQSHVEALVQGIFSSSVLTINLLRTSFTSDEYNVSLRKILTSTFSSLLSHIPENKIEYYVAAGWVPRPSPSNELSEAFHASNSSNEAVIKELMSTPAFSRVAHAYAAGMNHFHLDLDLDNRVYPLESLKRMGFKHYPQKLAALGMAGRVEDVSTYLSVLTCEELNSMATIVRVASESDNFSSENLMSIFNKVYNEKEGKKGRSIYPTLKDLTPDELTPSAEPTADEPPLALPPVYNKTQYSSVSDYVQTQYSGYSREFHYELREDMVSNLRRMSPSATYEEPITTIFQGWSKYCSKVDSFEVVKVGKPLLGRVNPRVVEATFTIDLSHFNDNITREWDNWDDANLYLINVNGSKVDNDVPPTNLNHLGVERVRGCRVISVTDNDGNELTNHWGSTPTFAKSPIRNVKVNLDTTQFYLDEKVNKLDVYKEFNVVMRRDPVNNNAPPFLKTLNSISQTTSTLPKWLEPTFLGFGNPEDAWGGGEKMKRWAEITPGVPKPTDGIDFGTCFQDDNHIKSSFPKYKTSFSGSGAGSKLKFDSSKKTVAITHYEIPNNTKSTPRFTPVQVEAIKSGINPGLTLVVGPPGTGKTDTAVAIITNLVRSYPNQRILMVTHSNAALNDLFEKIVATNIIDERYMIRLGGGEKQLNVISTHDFTKRGRVAYTLARRDTLLKDVQLISESLYVGSKNDRGPNGESSYTCETAELFNKHHVIARIQLYYSNGTDAPFPFAKYCELTGQTEPSGEEATKAYFDKLQELFDELKDFRAFELLRGGKKRSEYLLTKQAKIVACTVTHAGLARDQLIDLGFKYDSVIVEEAGQQLEVETFIPLLLQKDQTRLKRVCLFGDHNQLPPILKDRDLSEKGNFSQSFFARMLSLGMKSFTLDSQGRARPEIASLYDWRYGGLKALPNTSEGSYATANGGLLHTTQFINVGDHEGRGENCPTPYFYQNLGEAEYVVAMFQYLVLIGYDPKSITILSTYNGQKALIEDVLRARCNNVIFRFLPQVFTVDKYQGQQNDIILLSLVRTERVGHLRDIRRLVVALSRSRLGLYVFGRTELFKEVRELEPAFNQMWDKGTDLQLVKGEGAGSERKSEDIKVKKDKLHLCKSLVDLGQIVGSLQSMALQGV